MDDEHFMQHMETEHSGDMRMSFLREPEQPVRRLREPEVWRTYHKTLHRLWPERHDHDHDWNQMEQHVPQFVEHTEKIWVAVPRLNEEQPVLAWMTPEPARAFADSNEDYHSAEPATLRRPSLAPIYGGETLLEALWGEMDRLMEGLMTGEDAEDGGDKYRAAELAWVLAVVSNPYAPSVDAIRAETMDRWNASQEAAEIEERNAIDTYNTQLSGGTGDEFA